MNINAIKIELIQWLTQIEDENTLAKVKAVCEESDWWDGLPTSAKESIDNGLDDIVNDRVVDYKQVRKRIKDKFDL